MKNRKNFLKEAGVLMVVAILLFTSLVIVPITVAQTPEYEAGLTGMIFKPKVLSQTNQEVNTFSSMGKGNIIFSQRPFTPFEDGALYISDLNLGYLCMEDFWGLNEPIFNIHWYGFPLTDDFYQGDPTGMKFEIKFYEDNGGLPGTNVATFSNLEVTTFNTSISYDYLYQYYWETYLPSSVTLANGWVSIQSTYCPDESRFYWMSSPEGNFNALLNGVNVNNNLAFELTGKSVPKMCCNGDLMWDKVKAGSIVNGTFQVYNCGQPGSLLNWKINSTPDWGTWTLTPSSGTDLTINDNITITVEVVSPTEKKKTFTGKIKIINSDDPSDFCEIDVSLTTPRPRASNFIQNILQRFPNALPILRHILV